MAFIKVLKDSNDNTIYPQSLTSAVIDSKGNSLDTIHQQFVMATAVETEIEDIDTSFENVANKVTSISADSTDIEYPSAKAVYTAVNESKAVGVKIVVAASKDEVAEPDTTTIYLIGSASPYEEYLYLGDGNWELIGSTSVDLSEYATTETTNLLDAALTQLDNSVSEHTGTLVNSENGIHGIKYQDNNLQVLNPTSYEWETIQTSGGNSSPITLIPDGTDFIDNTTLLANGLYLAEGDISFNGTLNPYFSNAFFAVRGNTSGVSTMAAEKGGFYMFFEIIYTPYYPNSAALSSTYIQTHLLQNMKMYKAISVTSAGDGESSSITAIVYEGDDASVEVIDLYTMLPAASATQAGVVKMNADGSNLYITNDGSDAG